MVKIVELTLDTERIWSFFLAVKFDFNHNELAMRKLLTSRYLVYV